MKKVAYKLNSNGKCVKVLEVKVVSEEDYNKLLNDEFEYEQEELKAKVELNKAIHDLTEEVNNLKKEIRVLKGEEE